MRIAIIDLGTNTFNLLIADLYQDGTYKSLFKTKIPTKLGEGTILKKLISKDAFDRGINALKNYKILINNFNVERTYAFATSAIRSARNGKNFVKAALLEAGVNIQVITGEKEAEFIYHGVRRALNIGEEPSLLLDIGGGSNEFIIGTSTEPIWKGSFDVGGARMLIKFKPDDPISDHQIIEIEKHLENILKPLFNAVKENPVKELIGSSGSFETFATLVMSKFYVDESLKGRTEFQFNMDEFYAIHETLLKSTKDERMQMKGMSQMRVEMITLSAIFVNYLLKKLNITKMRFSSFALKEGVLIQIVEGRM